MFTAKDKEMLSNPYFNIVTENPVMYEVQSKNTGHYWVILPLIDHKYKYVRLMHTYKKEHLVNRRPNWTLVDIYAEM